jgi:DNA-binding NarL/FixJ family response regulator
MKVLVVDDHVIVREGVKALLELEEDIEAVYEASSGLECLDMIDCCSPDLVLIDLKMPGIGGIEAVRLIKESHPEIKVILLTNYDNEEYILQAIKSKADGYLLKGVKKGDLPRIMRHVLSGHSYLDSSVTSKVFRYIQSDLCYSGCLLPELSYRELQILEAVVEGKSNREIAQEGCISLDTVKSHLKHIYQKIGVSTRSQAIKSAIKQGLIQYLP